MRSEIAETVVVKDKRDIGTIDVLKAYLDTQPAPILDDHALVTLGSGPDRYRLLNDWAKLPADTSFTDVAALEVLPDDRVVIFGRGPFPVVILDRDGNVLDRWGAGMFGRPHGIHHGHDGYLYCVDDGDHTVRKCTLDGTVVMTLGIAHAPSPYMSGRPFARPTDTALSPSGEIYVTDGYLNAHVHKFAPDGRHLLTWGGSGIGPGEFNIPHNIVCDADGWVYVADRENHRVQVFDAGGRYETQWTFLHRPTAFRRSRGGGFLVGELGPSMPHIRYAPNLGPRVRLLSASGKVTANLGDKLAADAADRFIAPHAIGMDSHGDIYVGEVATSYWSQIFPGTQPPKQVRTLRKLQRLHGA